MVLYQVEAGAAAVVLVPVLSTCHGCFYSILKSCKMARETSEAFHFSLLLVLAHSFGVVR